jgi:hypothetical protein
VLVGGTSRVDLDRIVKRCVAALKGRGDLVDIQTKIYCNFKLCMFY